MFRRVSFYATYFIAIGFFIIYAIYFLSFSLNQKNISLIRDYTKVIGQSKLWGPIASRNFHGGESFKASELEIELTKFPKPKPDSNNLPFGKNFSDHMLNIDWDPENGWSKPKILPFQNFSMHPASKVFHYAIEVISVKKYCIVFSNVF